MITSLALAGYAVLVGAVAPYVLARATWAHGAPGVAVLAWQGLMVTFVVTTALAVYHVTLSEQHGHNGLIGLLSVCGLLPAATTDASGPTTADAAFPLVPAVIVLLPIGWLLRTAWRTRRVRRRHLDMLALVGRPAPEYGATIVDHDTPSVYCLPGRSRRIVVTRGALDVLSAEQLRAALEHERAHIACRHHIFLAATQGFEHAFPGLPLARHAREQTALLLEMIADDRALRWYSREVLASAMCEVAAGRAPQAAFGAGGPGALIRLRRVLNPQARPHRMTWLGIVSAAVAAPVLPLLITCGPG
ncbi:M56 family metallopeptidase [Streptomyces sp. TRM68367]|uniref:M56 family metallopeptidase n=1 Tax=Streptomyces sp. TRM68367 TaxID=2758415 RepID=UPI00165C046E|nr:M56 family metallopeptidase [Streptomyces sp. TRM68367]MBC9725038.1 M56 family metallopeptidase [Streptomyces sp. TRM68367]